MHDHIFGFEKLDVWKLARMLAREVYGVTSKFPDSERYGLTSQLRRSSVSIASNLAEGSSRTSYKNQAHFTTMAYGSLMELLNQLMISCDLGYLQDEDLALRREDIFKLSLKLNNYRNAQLSKIEKPG